MSNPQVDQFLLEVTTWQDEFRALRAIALDCGLEEAFKWKNPCYTFKGKNVLMLGGFKDYCAMSFFKGSLLNDSENLLHSPGENSQAFRFFRFTNLDEISSISAHIRAYIFEAIELEKAGLKVPFKKEKEFSFPEELEAKFKEIPALKEAFTSLTPGRQRGYLLFFEGAKQSSTRTTRIEKYIPRILSGKGFHDCVCGHTKKPPTCDGSHKYFE